MGAVKKAYTSEMERIASKLIAQGVPEERAWEIASVRAYESTDMRARAEEIFGRK